MSRTVRRLVRVAFFLPILLLSAQVVASRAPAAPGYSRFAATSDAESGEAAGNSRTSPSPDSPDAPTLESEKFKLGRALFSGEVRFAAGGAPCGACHTAGPLRSLDSRTLGPDLTAVYEDMGGAEGLQELLSDLDFPVMSAIYRDGPLTDGEKQALVAFFARLSETGARPQAKAATFGGIGGYGALLALILFVLMFFFRPRQKDMFEILRRKS